MNFRLALFLWSTTSPLTGSGASFVHHHANKNVAVVRAECTQSRPFLPSVCPMAAASDDEAPASSSSTRSSAVTVTRLADSAVEIEIPVPGTATKAAYDKVCNELSKNINIPGFRKGSRIPPQVLEQTMAAKGGVGSRNAIKVRAINELLLQLVEPIMKEQSLQPIGQATLKIPAEELAESYKPGQELRLPVKCDVWPEIEWIGGNEQEKAAYVGLEATYQRKPFNQAKMDLALRDLKERYVTLEPIDDDNYALQMGDACTVNMDGYMAKPDGSKGEPLPNAASGDRVEVVLGKGRYMEGLVEGLVGAKVGETRTVKVNFPEKLRDKTLAGKGAIFDVEVLEASRRSVPEVTDEFAARVRPGLTAAELFAELRKAIDEEDAKEFKPERNKALGDSLAKVMNVQVPDTLVTNQAREKFAVMMSDMRNGGVADEEIKRQINPENFAKYKDIVKADIIRDFKISMAADEIARLEQITVPAYQIEEQMENIKKDASESKEDFDEAMIRAKVESTMTRQAVFDWLAERGNLHVEYESDNNGQEQFDQELLQTLAKESLEREGIDSSVAEAVVAEVEEELAVLDAEVVDTTAPVEELKQEVVAAAAVVEPEPAGEETKVDEKKEEAVSVAAEVAPEPVKDQASATTEEKKDDSNPNLFDAFSNLFKF